MSRQRIQNLLAQLEANQAAELKVDAKIFATAQVATNMLADIAEFESTQQPLLK